jgi:hypothetical protein
MRHTSLSRLVSSCIILAACSSDDSSSLTGPDTEPPTVDLALSPASLTEAGEITLAADPHDAIEPVSPAPPGWARIRPHPIGWRFPP